MTNPFYDPYLVLTKVYSDGAHLKLALSQTPVEELHRARTVKICYGVLENDGYLSLCVKTFAQRSPKAAMRVLLKIALYHLLFLEKPRYMVTDTAVDLCKKLGKSGMAGFLNAFLRNFDAEKVILPQGDEGLSVKYNFPLFAVKRLKAQYKDRAEAIMSAKSFGVSVRFLRGKERYLSLAHVDTPFEDVKIFPNFVRDDAFSRGDYTFQSVGSVAICSVVEPCDALLDACAAPGGKSVLLARKCREVTAAELYPHRAELIRGYVSRMGCGNVTVLQADATVFSAVWENAFDGVLCDVPCSGFGTVAENPDLPLNKTEEQFLALPKTQLAILENCARYVKRGGALYYSTCSVFEEENDGVLRAFLERDKRFSAERTDCPLAHERTVYGLQFLPDKAFGAGFYVAKLRRNA